MTTMISRPTARASFAIESRVRFFFPFSTSDTYVCGVPVKSPTCVWDRPALSRASRISLPNCSRIVLAISKAASWAGSGERRAGNLTTDSVSQQARPSINDEENHATVANAAGSVLDQRFFRGHVNRLIVLAAPKIFQVSHLKHTRRIRTQAGKSLLRPNPRTAHSCATDGLESGYGD